MNALVCVELVPLCPSQINHRLRFERRTPRLVDLVEDSIQLVLGLLRGHPLETRANGIRLAPKPMDGIPRNVLYGRRESLKTDRF